MAPVAPLRKGWRYSQPWLTIAVSRDHEDGAAGAQGTGDAVWCG